jgi:hypothetical protein
MLAAGALVALVSSCSAPAAPKGVGGVCTLVSDCALPLVCIPQADGSHRCSDDTSSIVHVDGAGGSDAAGTGPAAPATADDAAAE